MRGCRGAWSACRETVTSEVSFFHMGALGPGCQSQVFELTFTSCKVLWSIFTLFCLSGGAKSRLL